jgi:predicted NUDIX family NTP pyrophosphohydrolase
VSNAHSAGVVLYRTTSSSAGANGPDASEASRIGLEEAVEILLVHPGGPYWADKEEHGWSIPKGEFDPAAEDGRNAAWREFEEELGRPVPAAVEGGEAVALPPFNAGRKTIHAWLVEADFDAGSISSNTVEIEWPPRTGRIQTVPEVDRAAWFSLARARTRLHKGQVGLVKLIIAGLTERPNGNRPAPPPGGRASPAAAHRSPAGHETETT